MKSWNMNTFLHMFFGHALSFRPILQNAKCGIFTVTSNMLESTSARFAYQTYSSTLPRIFMFKRYFVHKLPWPSNCIRQYLLQMFTVESHPQRQLNVIFLHGLGDTGDGVSNIFDKIRQPHIKYVFPTANCNPVTVNHGRVMPSWFDIHGLKSSSSEDAVSVEAAAHLLQTFIAEEEKLGVERNRIVVGGISQGGATSLYSLLTIPQSPLAGIIGLSTWLPLHKKFPDVAKANFETPMLLCHGEADPLVSVDFGRMSYERIRQFNKKVQFKTYPGLRHWVHDEEMKEVERFINAWLPPV